MSSQTNLSPLRKNGRRIVGVSTKMYFSLDKTSNFISDFLSAANERLPAASRAKIASTTDVFIIPDFIQLREVIQALSTRKTDQAEVPSIRLLVGAQDCCWEDYGPFTGEVSPAVLADLGCRLVELGHAERRKYFAETDEVVAKKAQAVVRNGMVPLVCVGEVSKPPQTAAEEGEQGLEKAVEEVMVKVRSVLGAIEDDHAEVVLAYEPVWAIGASEPAGVDHVLGVVRRIRDSDEFRARKEGSVRILYGGSAGPGLFDKLKTELDGLFLGRFAHDPEQFLQTIREVSEA